MVAFKAKQRLGLWQSHRLSTGVRMLLIGGGASANTPIHHPSLPLLKASHSQTPECHVCFLLKLHMGDSSEDQTVQSEMVQRQRNARHSTLPLGQEHEPGLQKAKGAEFETAHFTVEYFARQLLQQWQEYT